MADSLRLRGQSTRQIAPARGVVAQENEAAAPGRCRSLPGCCRGTLAIRAACLCRERLMFEGRTSRYKRCKVPTGHPSRQPATQTSSESPFARFLRFAAELSPAPN
jgi:hypothetical protein